MLDAKKQTKVVVNQMFFLKRRRQLLNNPDNNPQVKLIYPATLKSRQKGLRDRWETLETDIASLRTLSKNIYYWPLLLNAQLAIPGQVKSPYQLFICFFYPQGIFVLLLSFESMTGQVFKMTCEKLVPDCYLVCISLRHLLWYLC